MSPSELPSELLNFLDERQIGGTFRDELLRLQGADVVAIIRLVRALRPSENTLRDLFNVCREISARDSTPLAEIVDEPEIAAVLADECQLGRKERKRRIDEVLNRMRYPETTRIREDLSSCVRQIAADVGLRVVVPDDLEGVTVTVSVSLASAGDAATAAERFAALSAHPKLPHLFRLLRGTV